MPLITGFVAPATESKLRYDEDAKALFDAQEKDDTAAFQLDINSVDPKADADTIKLAVARETRAFQQSAAKLDRTARNVTPGGKGEKYIVNDDGTVSVIMKLVAKVPYRKSGDADTDAESVEAGDTAAK